MNACLRSGRRPNRHDVVTHALEEKLLRRYDGIVALKDGRVAEMGTFDELMAKKGYFYALYTVPTESRTTRTRLLSGVFSASFRLVLKKL